MSRLPLSALALACALTSHGLADPVGWLGGSAAPEEAAEEKLPIRRFKRVKAKDKQLSQLLQAVMNAVYREQPAPKLALTPAQSRTLVTLNVQNATIAEFLDIAGAATGMTLRIRNNELSAKRGYQQPKVRPPTPGEIHSLMQKFTLKAKDQDAGKVLRMLANVLGISAATPSELEHIPVTIHSKGNAAQALETLSSQLNRRVWIDGRALRVATSCGRISQPETTFDSGLTNKIKRLKAKDQALYKVASLLAMAGKRTAQVDPSIADLPVDLDVSNITIPRALERLAAKYSILAEVDGVFLRMRPRGAVPCPSLSGPEWHELTNLVYPPLAPSQEFGPNGELLGGDEFGLGGDDFGDF